MKLDVNGSIRELDAPLTLEHLIAGMAGTLRGSAAIVDDEVVPRSAWAAFQLQDGQHVELITAVQGG